LAGKAVELDSVGQVSSKTSKAGIDRFSVIQVAVAAVMWVSDAYFRNQLIKHLSPTQIVVAEDALIALFLLPVLIRSWHEVRGLGTRGWIAVGLIALKSRFREACTPEAEADTTDGPEVVDWIVTVALPALLELVYT